jgi:Leucine-rich repeat (LRR) protein
MIENLTLKEVTALKEIWLDSNQLKYIDTSACKALTTLRISSNPIESFTCLNIYKPSIVTLTISETYLDTLSIKEYESLNTLRASNCKNLK